jgi:hypothetical protein
MIQLWTYLAISLALIACGGGSGNSAPSTDQAQTTPSTITATRVLDQSADKNTVETYAVGDLNGDGLDDVVIGGWTGGTNYLAIMIQNPNGTLTDRTVALAGTNQYPGSNHIFIGDFDHDGYADIWLPGDDDRVTSTSSMMLWGSASGVFVRQTVDAGIHSQGACVTDLNQDGHVDVLIMGTHNPNINTYGYYLNNGNRTFSPLVASLHVNGGSACAVIRDAATGHFAIFQGGNSQMPGFQDSISIVDSQLNLIKQIAIPKQDVALAGINGVKEIDVNGDGLLDFVINYEAWEPGAAGRKEVWLNQGSDNFAYAYTLDSHNSTGNIVAFIYQGDQYCYFNAPNGDAMLFRRENGQLVPYLRESFWSMARALGARPGVKDWSVWSSTVYRGASGMYMLQHVTTGYYTQKL